MDPRPRLITASRAVLVAVLAWAAVSAHWQLPRRIQANLPDVVRGLTLDDDARLRREPAFEVGDTTSAIARPPRATAARLSLGILDFRGAASLTRAPRRSRSSTRPRATTRTTTARRRSTTSAPRS